MRKAGQYRHRVDFEKQVRQTNPANGDVKLVWSAVDNGRDVPAKIEYLRGNEYFAAQAVQSEVIAYITVPFRAGLKPAQRIVHRTARGTTIFNPKAVLPDDDSGFETLRIPVATGVNDG